MPTKKTKKDTLVDKVVLFGSSLVYLTKGATDELVKILERNDIVSTKEGKEAVEKVKAQLSSRQEKVRKHVMTQLAKVLDELGVATKKDLEELKKKSSPKKTA